MGVFRERGDSPSEGRSSWWLIWALRGKPPAEDPPRIHGIGPAGQGEKRGVHARIHGLGPAETSRDGQAGGARMPPEVPHGQGREKKQVFTRRRGGGFAETGRGGEAASVPREVPRGPGDVRYRAQALRVAEKTLSVADQRIGQWIKAGRFRADLSGAAFSSEQLRETVAGLQDTHLWARFFREYGLADNEAARAAVNDLVKCFANVTADQINPGTLLLLRAAIKTLQREIGRLHADSVSVEYAEQCRKVAERIGWQVAAGGAAAAANAGAGGGVLGFHVVLAALAGSVAGAVVDLVHDSRSQRSREGSDRERLRTANDELRNQIQLLAGIMRQCGEGEPAADGLAEAGRDACLLSSLLVMYAGQLAAGADNRRGGDEYRAALRDAKALLDEIPGIIDRSEYSGAEAVARRLDSLWDCLGKFGYYLDPP